MTQPGVHTEPGYRKSNHNRYQNQQEKSFDQLIEKIPAEAPKTLRIPISFVRVEQENITNTQSPRQDMNIANPVKEPIITPNTSS